MNDTLAQLPKSVALEELNNRLRALKALVESIEVKDAQSFATSGAIKMDIGAFTKAVIFATGPEIEVAKEHLRRLQAEQKMLTAPAEAILSKLEEKRRAWANEERRKAEEEQRRINEERRIEAARKAEEERKEREKQAEIERKAREKEIEAQRKAGEIKAKEAERLRKEAAAAQERERIRAAEDAKKAAESVQPVTVKPNIPTVAGTKNQVYWKFRIVHPALIPITYRIPDEVAIGRMVRDTKDKAKAEAQCPGIEVWSE
jgi:hypothetical protein